MKKMIIIGGLALFLAVGTGVSAGDGSGIETSGHVDVVSGWHHADQDAGTTFGSAIGEFTGAPAGNDDTFQFFIDSVELDIGKTFGENIRLRADIDFVSATSSGLAPATGGVVANLEQAYVTSNIALGNGVELLVGRFNVPIGFEPVDRNELTTVSHSNIFNTSLGGANVGLIPINATGAKFYYAGEQVDVHLYIVNDLNDGGVATDSAYPSGGVRVGFNWGEEGSESTIGLSLAGGPEQPNQNTHFDYLADIDFAVQVSDSLLIGGEALGRQRNADPNQGETNNARVFAGLLLVNYEFSEVWDGTFRADYVNVGSDAAANAEFGGVEQQVYAAAVAAGYQITDDAKFKLEYKFEYADPAAGNKADYHSVVGEWAYNF